MPFKIMTNQIDEIVIASSNNTSNIGKLRNFVLSILIARAWLIVPSFMQLTVVPSIPSFSGEFDVIQYTEDKTP